VATQRKPWHAPELIVLARSRPEEAVLMACKIGNTAGPNDMGAPPWNCKSDASNKAKCVNFAQS
jgi:hypothetical protein